MGVLALTASAERAFFPSRFLPLAALLVGAESIDSCYRPPAPTAQNARQEGLYLAKVFNTHRTPEEKAQAPSFKESWSGSLAYVGTPHELTDKKEKGEKKKEEERGLLRLLSCDAWRVEGEERKRESQRALEGVLELAGHGSADAGIF